MQNKNIRLAYWLTFLSEFYLPFVPFLFFYLKYFDFAQIATLTAVQMAASNILEIPTGAFADVVGRRKAIILSFVVGSVALALFPFVTAFWVFVVLEVLKGLANALYSGSMEAMVYDEMKGRGEEENYDRVASNMETIGWIGILAASLMAGYIYNWHFRAPWIIQSIQYALAVVVSWRLVEPRLDSIKVNIKEAWRQNWEGFRELFASARTTRVTLQLGLIGVGYIMASNFLGHAQAREYGLDARGVGILFSAGYVFSIVASRFFPQLRRSLGESRLVAVTGSMMIVSFVLAKFVGVALGSMLVIMRIASSSTFRNARSVIVNKWISSRNRATTLSTLNLLTQAPYIVLAPLLGLAIDNSSPNQFAWGLGLMILTLLGLSHILRYRTKVV